MYLLHLLEEQAAMRVLERQALSEAIQVFAGMTAESAINLLGVMALGEDQFLQQVERRATGEKLLTLLRVIEGKPPSNEDELLVVAARLADARNAFVHPKPQEGLPRKSDRERRSDLRSARDAVKDMERLLELLQRRNQRYGSFFIPF